MKYRQNAQIPANRRIHLPVCIRVNLPSIQLCNGNPDAIINLTKFVDKMYIQLFSFAILYNCAMKFQLQLSTLGRNV